ncbi:MAG TPA: hypothetical protein ENJ95_12095 [Bacteroidetes bacterium]|nr:hypothetical protein [Bacteroidota bacterium]
MKEDKILTLHPEGQPGAMLLLHEYEMAKEAIVEFFLIKPTGTVEEINTSAANKLGGKIKGEINPFLTSVRLDMEARDYIEKVPGSDPTEYRLKLIRC